MPYILFYSTFFFLFPSPTLSPRRRHCGQAHVSAPMIYSGATSALPSTPASRNFNISYGNLQLSVPISASSCCSSPGCEDRVGAAAPKFFLSFLDAVESLPPPSSSVTNPGWHRVPCQCHQPWLCPGFIHEPGIHQDLPVHDPFVQFLGKEIPSCRMKSSCLEFTRIYLLITLFFSPWVKKSLPGAVKAFSRAGARNKVLSFPARISFVPGKPRLGFEGCRKLCIPKASRGWHLGH